MRWNRSYKWGILINRISGAQEKCQMHAMHNIGKILFVSIVLNLLFSQHED